MFMVNEAMLAAALKYTNYCQTTEDIYLRQFYLKYYIYVNVKYL